jgi:hypothetical protein
LRPVLPVCAYVRRRSAGAWKRSITMSLKLTDKAVEKSVARLIKRKLIKQVRATARGWHAVLFQAPCIHARAGAHAAAPPAQGVHGVPPG